MRQVSKSSAAPLRGLSVFSDGFKPDRILNLELPGAFR